MRTVTVNVDEVLHETDLALLFLLSSSNGNQQEIWVPKSVIEDADDISVGDSDVEIEIAEWFTEKEGIA